MNGESSTLFLDGWWGVCLEKHQRAYCRGLVAGNRSLAKGLGSGFDFLDLLEGPTMSRLKNMFG